MAKVIDAKSLVQQIEGRREPKVPVYQFGQGVVKYEHPNHNPFKEMQSNEQTNNSGN
jgi:hypothetical protein